MKISTLQIIRLKCLLALLIVGLAFTPNVSKAQLDFVFDSATQKVYQGNSVTYTATLTNTGTAELFLNGSDFDFNAPGLTLVDQFLENAPLSLTTGQSWNGAIFRLDLASDAEVGLFSGSYSVLGGNNATEIRELSATNFRVNARVPGPASLATFLCGGTLGMVALIGRKRKK